MSVRLAAFAALVAVSAIAWPANAADRLSLDDAFARVAESHPDLRLLGARHNVLAAELGRATLRPHWSPAPASRTLSAPARRVA